MHAGRYDAYSRSISIDIDNSGLSRTARFCLLSRGYSISNELQFDHLNLVASIQKAHVD